MNPVPSPRRTLVGGWLRAPPRVLCAVAWMAVMWPTAGLTRATTSAKDGGAPGAASVLPGAGIAPPPPIRTPRRAAMAATSANDRTRTGRGISLRESIARGSAGSTFGQEPREALLVEDGHPQLLGLVALGARVLPRHHVGRLLRDRRGHAAAARLDGGLGLVAGHGLQAAREDELLARERIRPLVRPRLFRAHARLLQARHEVAVGLAREPVPDRPGHGRPDLVDRVDLVDGGGADRVQAAEMPGQERGRPVAHEADAQAEDQPAQLARLARLDAGQERGR